jgi:hypothetical protein
MGWKRCRGADNDDMLGGASDRRAYADDRERERERERVRATMRVSHIDDRLVRYSGWCVVFSFFVTDHSNKNKYTQYQIS